jgi:hypothetical protein
MFTSLANKVGTGFASKCCQIKQPLQKNSLLYLMITALNMAGFFKTNSGTGLVTAAPISSCFSLS